MITEIPPERDAEGYLFDPEQWSESVAYNLAEKEGIALQDSYWPVLQYMRQHWTEGLRNSARNEQAGA